MLGGAMGVSGTEERRATGLAGGRKINVSAQRRYADLHFVHWRTRYDAPLTMGARRAESAAAGRCVSLRAWAVLGTADVGGGLGGMTADALAGTAEIEM